MRKKIIPFLILLFVLISTGLLMSQKNDEDAKFQKLLDNYFDALWKFYPTTATLEGYHKYDNKLEDLSNKNIEKRHEALDEFNQEFVAKIDRTKLSPDLKIDHGIIIDALELELLNHENLLPWDYNPIFYNNIFINSIRSLFTKEFASLDIRSKNAVERLKNLPNIIKQAKENLKTPPPLHTETAIRQFPAVLNFYKNELPKLIDEAPASYKSKLQSNLSKVIPALEDYQNFLKNELLPKSTGNFRLAQAHPRLWRSTFQMSLSLDELISRQRANINNIRREMFLVCIPFYRIMYPKINLEKLTTQRGETEVRNIVIKGVLNKIKSDHVPKDEFLNKIKSTSSEVKDFLLKKQLIDLPEEDLNIEPMPLEVQGISWTRLIRHGVYEASGSYTCQIAPISDDLEEEQIQSLLEEYNNFFLPFYTTRKVYPGEFVPLILSNKNSSLVRKLYPNMPLIKAWPVFIEEMMIYSGFGNYDLRRRLNQLKYRLKTALDFTLEFNIHEGGMTKEDAIAYMERVGFQTQAEAERNWNRIILNPGDAAYPYVGLQILLDLEKEYRKIKGESYNQKEFMHKILSYGAIPLRNLREKILED